MASIKLPRITTAQRTGITLLLGEIVYDTDLDKFFGGDGSTVGGFEIGSNISAAQVKSLYESNANTNAFTDNEQTKLAGIETGAEVNNISDSDATDLTDGNDSTLHFHASDRDRANHTSTQLASTISDFDTEVSGNSDVTSNTAKVSADGSVGTHSDVDLTGLADNDLLQYNSTSGKFEPASHGSVGGVSSFNSRTGAVVPASGDYDADEITETATREFVTPAEVSLIGTSVQPGDNVSDLVNDQDYIRAGGVCRIERTGTFYTTFALAIAALQDDDTLIVYSGNNSSLDMDFSSSSLSRITIFGKGPADNSANTRVGQVTLDSTCGAFSFQNIDFYPANDDSVTDSGSTGSCFVECSFNRTSGSTGLRLSGTSASGPTFVNCSFVKDVSLNATNFATFAFFRECNIPNLNATNNGGFQLRRCQVSSQVNVTGNCIVDINDCAISYLNSSQSTLGFDTLVLNDVRVRSFATGGPSTINKTGTASYRLINVDFDRAGSTLTGTDNSNHYPTSFSLSLTGKALTDLTSLSRVAGQLHYATNNNRFYADDGSNLNQIAHTSDITAAPVDSVFGRTGAVVSTNGDYDADQITETATRVFVTPSEKTSIGTAVQPGDNVSGLTNDAGYITSAPVSSVNTQTGVVVLDADNISDATTTNKFATQAQLDKADFITVTQAVDLDTIETDVTTNNSKVSASGSVGTHSDVDLTGLSNDDVLVYDSTSGTFKPEAQSAGGVTSVNTQTGAVVLDADDISDATTTNKYASQAQLDKVDFISITQSVDLDTLETDVTANNSKVSASGSVGTHSDVDLTGLSDNDVLIYDTTSSSFKPEPIPPAPVDSVNSQTGVVVLDADDISDAATTNKFASQGQLDKVDFITVTQAVDLDTLESDVATNNAKVSADGSINTHSDVDTSSTPPTSGDVLRWNAANSEWEPDSLVATVFKYRKTFVAERNGSSQGKLAWGNGSTVNTMGAVITESCSLISVGISSSGVTGGTWDIYRNGVSIHSTSKPVSLVHVDNLSSPVALNANDYVNAVCITAGGASHTVTFEVEVEVSITGLKGDPGVQGSSGTDGIAQVRTGTGAPAAGLGNDGDFYLNNTNGDYYTKAGGSWTLQGNLKGPSAASSNVLKLTNTVATNINDATGVTFGSFDTTTLLNDFGADISITSNTITFNTSGKFRCDFNFYLTSTVSRSNVEFRWSINGVNQIGRTANNYIRDTSGHNESSGSLSEIFDISSGDDLTIFCIRAAAAGTVTVPAGTSIFQIERLS